MGMKTGHESLIDSYLRGPSDPKRITYINNQAKNIKLEYFADQTTTDEQSTKLNSNSLKTIKSVIDLGKSQMQAIAQQSVATERTEVMES